MARQWSIEIVRLSNGTVAFRADIPGAKPGQPLGVTAGDLVTWNNRTKKAHWPVAIAPAGFLTNDIPAGKVSSPIVTIGNTVTYRCLHHPQETGAIVVVDDLVT
jgi:plastocyanin